MRWWNGAFGEVWMKIFGTVIPSRVVNRLFHIDVKKFFADFAAQKSIVDFFSSVCDIFNEFFSLYFF